MGAGTKVVARITGYAIALGLAGLLVACGGGGSEAPATSADVVAPKANNSLQRVQLPVSDWTGDDGQHVVRNTSDWVATWAAIQWLDHAAPSLTDVDFRRHMLVGVTASYGGCSASIAITSAQLETTPTGDSWVLEYQIDERENDPGRTCTHSLKPLADFILLPASPAAVRFIELPRMH